MQNISMDLGYSHTKVISDHTRSIFPSVVGSADVPRLSLTASEYIALNVAGREVVVGEGAVHWSRFLSRREDRSWIHSNEYMALFHAALSEACTEEVVEANVVTGLPVLYFDDADELRKLLLREHEIHRQGRQPQTIRVTRCRILMQPFGSLLAIAFDDQGRTKDPGVLTNLVGICDIGSHTTGILTVLGAEEVVRATTSVNAGSWSVLRAVRARLAEVCKDSDLNDHTLMQAVVQRSFTYYGEEVDLTSIVEPALDTLAERIISECSQLWGTGADLHTIVTTGGGSLLVGERLKRHFSRHKSVITVPDPVFGNCLGYYRFAHYLEEKNAW